MLGINCLIANPQIQNDVKDIVEIIGYELAAEKGSAKLSELYGVLRQGGLEIDIQTLANIYENTFDVNDATFSDQDSINAARQETFRKIATLTPKIVTQKIGKDKPSVAAAASVMKSLVKNITDKTVQKKMEERLAKAARRILGISNKPTTKTWDQLFEEVLETERNNDFYGLGAMDNAESLFNEMADELESEGVHYNNAEMIQYGQILKQATYDVLAGQGEINRMVTDTLKEAGYTREINVKGQPKQVIDWDKIIANKPDYKAELRNVLTNRNISQTNVDNIVDVLDRQYKDLLSKKIESKLATKNKVPVTKDQRDALSKLVELNDLNIFDNAQQDALARVTGLSQLDAEQVKQLRGILNNYKEGMKVPMAEFSPTFLKSIQRQVENFINAFEDKEQAVKVMSRIQTYMQLSNVAILSNPQNILENAISGAIEANVVTAINNPVGFIKSLFDFGNKFADFSRGGVRVGQEQANIFNHSGNIEDIYNAESKSGKRWDVIFATVPRILLGSMDNGFKHQIVQNLVDKTLRQVLVGKGATKEEANILMNNIYYGNQDQLSQIARQLSSRLVGAGIRTTTTSQGELNSKEKVILSELSLANMQSEGKFFQDMLSNLISSGQLDAALKNKLDIDIDLLKAIREAAYSTASKGLGHEADNELLKLFETSYATINKRIAEAREEKKGFRQASFMLLRSVLAGVNKFRAGGFNWLFLGLQKASGISLAQTLITDVALGKRRGIPQRFSDIDFGQENVAEQLGRYMALRQRLIRETVPVIASLSISAAAVAYLRGDGDGEEKKKRIREFRSYLDSHSGAKRWFNKLSPQILYNWLYQTVSVPLDRLPVINSQMGATLRDNGITDIGLDNMNRVKSVLGLTDKEAEKLAQAVSDQNNEEIQNLLSIYYNPNNIWPSIQNNVQPNPAIQWGIDMGDIKKPDKAAISGQALGNILNLGGVLRSGDIWKNSLFNPEKIEGEYKLIKPQGFTEGFMYQTVNKDLYKKFFVTDTDLSVKPLELPHVGPKGVAKLQEEGIETITSDNISKVAYILNLSSKKASDIEGYVKYREDLNKKIKGK